MTRANKALVVMVVALLGLWGCAQGPASNGAASLERIRALEGKCTKLEDDYRAVAAARDQLRKKLAAAEEDRARLQQDVNQKQALIKERDELRQQRDAVQAQYDQFRRGIRNLLGQAEATAAISATGAAGCQPAPPAVTTAEGLPKTRS